VQCFVSKGFINFLRLYTYNILSTVSLYSCFLQYPTNVCYVKGTETSQIILAVDFFPEHPV
jgi:hypothetical protein